MYTSSFADLGRFDVPAYIKEDWIPHIRYIPEPPAPIRGAMNPWQQERQRVLWMAEEKAWKQIQVLQREWAHLEARLIRLVQQYNDHVTAINARMEDLGQGSPLQKMGGYTSYLAFTSGPGALLAGAIQVAGMLEKGFNQIFGITAKKKKDVENWMRSLQQTEADLIQTQQRMDTVFAELQRHLNIAQTVASQQQVQITADVEQSEGLYAQRLAQEVARGQARRAVYRQIQTLPYARQSDGNGL